MAGVKSRLLCGVFGDHLGEQSASAKLLVICMDGFPTNEPVAGDLIQGDAHCALTMTFHQLMDCLRV